MFDIDAGKFIIVAVVALIFIPPKDLPRVMRQIGQFVGKMRRMASEFQGQFMDAMREADMADLRKEAQKLSDAARVSTGLDTLHDLNHQMTGALHHTPAAAAADGAHREEVGSEAGPAAPSTVQSGESGSHGEAEQLAEAARAPVVHAEPVVEQALEVRASADQPA